MEGMRKSSKLEVHVMKYIIWLEHLGYPYIYRWPVLQIARDKPHCGCVIADPAEFHHINGANGGDRIMLLMMCAERHSARTMRSSSHIAAFAT